MRTLLFANRVVEPVSAMTGIGRYVVEITRAMAAARHDHDPELVISGPHEAGEPAWLPEGVHYQAMPGPRKGIHLSWTVLGRPRLERLTGKFDLIHALHPSFPIPTSRPGVITVHDLMPLEHPEWYQRDETWGFRVAMERTAARNWHVIADSHHVARLLTNLGSLDPQRIHVVHLAVDDVFRQEAGDSVVNEAARLFGVEAGRYVLALGNVSTRKNLEVLVRAFAKADLPRTKLLLAGRAHANADVIRRQIGLLGVEHRVVLGGFVPDALLPALLQGAVALAHPSVDEGFGIPPIEAMAGGTPVLASAAGSLPEIVGDAGVLIAPDDVDGWKDAIEQAVMDDHQRALAAEAGRQRAAEFTWDRAATETLSIHRLAMET